LSLIVAIGAQNAFVLRQGLRREYVLPVVLTCAVSDALLISGGIAGLGALLTSSQLALNIAKYGGAAFLFTYAAVAARRALNPGAMSPADHAPAALRSVVLTCLGFTYLNPHVYLDTVVLLGALANQRGTDGRWIYGVGAVAASFTWFFALGFLARKLGPLFARPRAWQFLDAGIAVIMTALATWMLLP
jgi:L-lysine exporter family protein LysE/ArgO